MHRRAIRRFWKLNYADIRPPVPRDHRSYVMVTVTCCLCLLLPDLTVFTEAYGWSLSLHVRSRSQSAMARPDAFQIDRSCAVQCIPLYVLLTLK